MNESVQVCIMKYESHDSIIHYYIFLAFINSHLKKLQSHIILNCSMKRNSMSTFEFILFDYSTFPLYLSSTHSMYAIYLVITLLRVHLTETEEVSLTQM